MSAETDAQPLLRDLDPFGGDPAPEPVESAPVGVIFNSSI